MAIDSKGNIYLTQKGFYGIRKITPEGVISTFVGSTTWGYVEGKGTTARFKDIFNLEIDGQDNIYVADFENSRIRKVTADSIVSTSTAIADRLLSMQGMMLSKTSLEKERGKAKSRRKEMRMSEEQCTSQPLMWLLTK